MTHPECERFIPLTKSELVVLLSDHDLPADEIPKFRKFCKLLQSIFHFQFHEQLEFLKDHYFPFDPDRGGRTRRRFSDAMRRDCEHKVAVKLDEVLTAANYEKVSEQDLQHALGAASLFKIAVAVDFDDFAECLLYRRGATVKDAQVSRWFFWKRRTQVPVFERVAMLVKFKDHSYFAGKGRKNLPFEPGSMVIKLFKDVPRADLEMLFPNVRIRMRLQDLLLLGAGAVGGGVGVLLKAGAGLLAMVAVLWYLARSMVGAGTMPELAPGQVAAMIGGATALGMIAAFVWKQLNTYRFRMISFMKALADNLYFKNLDNNAGVFHHLIDAAEEEECKEAVLAYHFLLRSEGGSTREALDRAVEQWLADNLELPVDFEVEDALRKLKALGLCREVGTDGAGTPLLGVLPLDAACAAMDSLWDGFFACGPSPMRGTKTVS